MGVQLQDLSSVPKTFFGDMICLLVLDAYGICNIGFTIQYLNA
tara:strand:+ start:128 stop:256 length:129 start_codon:yes stop_codon:yes gene_type:complete